MKQKSVILTVSGIADLGLQFTVLSLNLLKIQNVTSATADFMHAYTAVNSSGLVIIIKKS